MQIIFLMLMVIHGLIHMIGFIKAFELAEISALTQYISKPGGILWLLAAVLFLATAVLYSLNKEWWWIPAVVAIVVSQIFIVLSWQDAKFGTIANIIILIAIIIGYGKWGWNIQINEEINKVLAQGIATEKTVITEQMLEPLPPPVQKWLTNSGMVGREKIYNVCLKQKGLMRLKPEQKEWTKAEAEQYITTAKPAFLWQVNMLMLPLVNVAGRDLLMDGQAELLIKMASTIPVAKAANNEKTNQSSLQRYLLELAWYPSAALSPYISWEAIDDRSAKATITHGGISGSAIFNFNDDGELVKCSAYRYKDNDEAAQPKQCIAEIKENSIINGIKIPTKIDISWVLDEGVFTWYKLEIVDIEYNKY